MKKEITHYEYFCDRCEEKTKYLYGPEGRDININLKCVPQAQEEVANITISYYLNQNSGKKIGKGSVCEKCLDEILQKVIKTINSALDK